jgi:hypothetical protein
MMTRSHRILISFSTIISALLLFVAGCGGVGTVDPPSGDAMPTGQQFNELMKRPNIDEVTSKYSEMLAKIRGELSGKLGVQGWQENSNGSQSPGCNDFHNVDAWDAKRIYLNSWIAPSSIPDDQWSTATRVLSEASGQYEFKAVTLQENKQGDHQFNIKDPYGAELSLGTAKNTLLTLVTGCHLTAEAHKRGTPRPSST